MKLGEFRRLTSCLTDEAEIVFETHDGHGQALFHEPRRMRLSEPLGAVVIESFQLKEPAFR